MEKKKSNDGKAKMKLSGWIFMVLSWTVILGMITFCFIRIFSKKELR
ncbi:MAG: hypothetical protein NC912_04935 [Candidatus Omnitrophica bacterium]|nr:hypothetical protein [Candidatus Omnitrophota bacterium]